MPCYYPVDGWRSKSPNESGNYGLSFTKSEANLDQPIKVSCGRCIGCRLDRSREWALRCTHEAGQHEDNSFLTLTYDDEHLPPGGSLDRLAFPKLIRKLRKKIAPKKVRYYMCGEYGVNNDLSTLDTLGRPHYHALLFGHDFDDKKLHCENHQGDLVDC